MKTDKVLLIAVVVLLGALSLGAQDKQGNIAGLEFQKPKNGMVKEYEAGRKQKVDWHKQQKDSQPLYVFETLTGPETGTYIVGRFGMHWADMDKPSVPDQADMDEYRKVIAGSVESMMARYYEAMPKVSHMDPSDNDAKFYEILTFHVKYGKGSDFRSAINRVHEAGEKTKWPVSYHWYEMVAGGETNTFVLSLPRKNWADFEDKPEVKPFRDMLKEAFGQAESDSIVDAIDRAVEGETDEIIQFRQDLSYMPAK